MAAGSLLLWRFSSPESLYSFELGAVLIIGNFIFLAAGWNLILQQKLVALATTIIVIKYAILGFIIYECLRWPWTRPLWLSLGVASFILTSLVFSLVCSSARLPRLKRINGF